jgi:hypothetical protein
MALDPVPYVIGNGTATLSGETMRSQYYSSMNGAEGITEINDFKVTQTPTPGSNIRLAAGSAALLNKYSGGDRQMYHIRAASVTDVPVAATGGASATKYVCLTVQDPQYGGSGSGASGPYDAVEVLTALPTGRPFLHLATIAQPANTSTITNAMITDARKVARPRKEPVTQTIALTAPTTETLTSVSAYPAGGQTWPVASETAWGTIPIPTWAAYVKIICSWSGVNAPGGDIWGFLWVQMAPTANVDNRKTQAVLYDMTGVANKSRPGFRVADTIYVPAGLRGTSVKFYPRGNVLGGSGSKLILDSGSMVDLQLEFVEKAD